MNFVSDFITAKDPSSLKEISFRGRLFSLAAFHKHLPDMEEKGLVYRRNHRREPMELVPVEMDTKARKIILLGRVNVSCTIENV